MKPVWTTLLWIGLMLAPATMLAQSEAGADTLTTDTLPMPMPEGVRDFGGYLLDMGGLMRTATPRPPLDLQVAGVIKDYRLPFLPQADVTYSQGTYDGMMPHATMHYGVTPFGLYGWGNGLETWQQGSFRLKSGWQLNTYGEYDKDGWKVPDPSALPWQRNNFRGAFELKSGNGSFGLRIEVRRGRETPF